MVSWIAGGGGAQVHGSPNIVGGCQFLLHCCEFPPASMIILGALMTMGCLAASCSLADMAFM